MVRDYDSERIQVKKGKGGKHVGRSPGETRQELPVILSSRSLTDAHSSSNNAM